VLISYIDWTFFFFSWKVPGKYPAIFDDPVKGEEARKLFNDAKEYIGKIKNKRIIEAKAVFGLFPALSDGDDVKVLPAEGGKEPLTTFRFLRNQEMKEKGVPNLSLSDYIVPGSGGQTDHIGAFVVSAFLNEEAMKEFGDDDYATIMIRILSDRLAEAAAEWLHAVIRRDYWGYATEQDLTTDDLLKSKYRGIRPAPGYPA